MSDLVVVAEAIGAAIAPVPLIEHWAASRLLSSSGVMIGDEIATLALREAGADGSWRLVPGGAVADIVVGIDGDELVAVRSSPLMSAPMNHASAPLADRSCRDGDRTVLGTPEPFALALDEWRLLT